jgi:hypothetical protein
MQHQQQRKSVRALHMPVLTGSCAVLYERRATSWAQRHQAELPDDTPAEPTTEAIRLRLREWGEAPLFEVLPAGATVDGGTARSDEEPQPPCTEVLLRLLPSPSGGLRYATQPPPEQEDNADTKKKRQQDRSMLEEAAAKRELLKNAAPEVLETKSLPRTSWSVRRHLRLAPPLSSEQTEAVRRLDEARGAMASVGAHALHSLRREIQRAVDRVPHSLNQLGVRNLLCALAELLQHEPEPLACDGDLGDVYMSGLHACLAGDPYSFTDALTALPFEASIWEKSPPPLHAVATARRHASDMDFAHLLQSGGKGKGTAAHLSTLIKIAHWLVAWLECQRVFDSAATSTEDHLNASGDFEPEPELELEPEPEPECVDDPDDGETECAVCFGPASWKISTTCDHAYCAECVQGSLEAILAANSFPAFCPACRVEHVSSRHDPREDDAPPPSSSGNSGHPAGYTYVRTYTKSFDRIGRLLPALDDVSADRRNAAATPGKKLKRAVNGPATLQPTCLGGCRGSDGYLHVNGHHQRCPNFCLDTHRPEALPPEPRPKPSLAGKISADVLACLCAERVITERLYYRCLQQSLRTTQPAAAQDAAAFFLCPGKGCSAALCERRIRPLAMPLRGKNQKGFCAVPQWQAQCPRCETVACNDCHLPAQRRAIQYDDERRPPPQPGDAVVALDCQHCSPRFEAVLLDPSDPASTAAAGVDLVIGLRRRDDDGCFEVVPGEFSQHWAALCRSARASSGEEESKAAVSSSSREGGAREWAGLQRQRSGLESSGMCDDDDSGADNCGGGRGGQRPSVVPGVVGMAGFESVGGAWWRADALVGLKLLATPSALAPGDDTSTDSFGHPASAKGFTEEWRDATVVRSFPKGLVVRWADGSGERATGSADSSRAAAASSARHQLFGVALRGKLRVRSKTEWEHSCPLRRRFSDKIDAATEKELRTNPSFKQCPNCSKWLQKSEGCDMMQCGNSAHSSIRAAVENGGCGFQFNWRTGKECQGARYNLSGRGV